MKFNTWALLAQIAAEMASLPAMQPGDTEELPPIHVKSGTTTVVVHITVSQDAKKH